jgi:ribonuclease P protein subunit RPR2
MWEAWKAANISFSQILYTYKINYLMAQRSRRQKPQGWLNIAKERIEILFSEARKTASDKPNRANRYVTIARKIGMRYNVRIPSKHRREFCHKCGSYLLPGNNCKVRTNSKTQCVEYYCQNCNITNRYGYGKEKVKNHENKNPSKTKRKAK